MQNLEPKWPLSEVTEATEHALLSKRETCLETLITYLQHDDHSIVLSLQTSRTLVPTKPFISVVRLQNEQQSLHKSRTTEYAFIYNDATEILA